MIYEVKERRQHRFTFTRAEWEIYVQEPFNRPERLPAIPNGAQYEQDDKRMVITWTSQNGHGTHHEI